MVASNCECIKKMPRIPQSSQINKLYKSVKSVAF
jgi:hypothetical protein